MVSDANHGKEETLTGHDGMREIDGFLRAGIHGSTSG